MRGSESFDGKMAGNRQLVDRYNESKSKKKKSGYAPQRPHETGGASGGVHEASGHDEIKQIVGEHGPAHSSHVMHDHAAGKFHVVSHHEDGHVHHAEHGNMEDVKEHLSAAHDDTEHMGDMDQDDYGVSREDERAEAGSAGSRVGFMA